MHTGDYKMIEVAYKLDTKKKVATVFFLRSLMLNWVLKHLLVKYRLIR